MNGFVIVASVAFFAILGFFGLAKGQTAAIGLAVLFFAVTGTAWTINHLRLKTSLPRVTGTQDQAAEDGIASRLEQVERRLTDIQDIMLAIDEKLDARPGPKRPELAPQHA